MEEFKKEKLKEYFAKRKHLSLEELMNDIYFGFHFIEFKDFGYVVHLYFQKEANRELRTATKTG